MSQKLEIQEFFVEGDDQQASHVLLHIAEPVTQEEHKKGYFFALVEVNESYPEQITQLQQIIDDIESDYYDEEILEEDTFEKILQKINKQSHHVLQYKDTEIHCVVGTLQDTRLILAYHGSPEALLYYKSKDILKETPIIDDDTDEQGQLFSAVVEGHINAGDHVYIATPHVNEYFSSDRVRKILQSRTTRQTTMHIQKVLGSLKNRFSFGGLVFHIPKTASLSQKTLSASDPKNSSQASLDNLLETAKSTEETLSPSLIKNVKEGLKKKWQDRHRGQPKEISEKTERNKLSKRLKLLRRRNKTKTTKRGAIETNYRPADGQSQETWTSKFLIIFGRTLVFLGTGLYVVLKKTAKFLVSAAQHLFFLTTNKNGQRTIILDKWRGKIDERKQTIINLSLFSKIVFMLLLVLVFIFIVSIGYLKIKENREAERAQYNNLVTAIEEKKADAEAKILYGEETKALETLQGAKRLIETLPQNKKQEKKKVTELNANIDEILLKLQKITRVEPELIVDLSQTNSEVKSKQIVWFDNKLIAFGPEDDALYFIDPVTKNVEIKKHETIIGLQTADVPKEDDKIIFISNGNELAEYEKESQTLTSKTIAYQNDNADIKDISIYNRKAYILDPANDQIYKHSQTQTGYDRGTEWITSKNDSLKNAVSLTVDGGIFVLTNNDVLKFFAGEQKGFEMRGLDPILENPTEIWTYSDVNNLYIIEPTNKRVVVVDKEGNFVGQYTSDVWNSPTGMVVDESEGVVFVLDNNKVYKFNY